MFNSDLTLCAKNKSQTYKKNMNPTITVKNTTPQELWSRQRISSLDVDYDFWNAKREVIQSFAQMSRSCIFTVDVFKGRYDFASENLSQLFGYVRNASATSGRKVTCWRKEFTLTTGRNCLTIRCNAGYASIGADLLRFS